MDSHPLNLAHQQHRRADAHLINHRYDEAMQCHHNAAELLLDAMKSTTSSNAIESITLQHSYHLKQKDLIKTKKDQYARVKKAMENLQCLGKDPNLNLQGHENSKVQVALYRTINEADSLLQLLADSKVDKEKNETVKDVTEGKKMEKTQQQVVEELQTLSQSLHSLVEQLVFQVEVLRDENMTMKERVSYLEKERTKYLSLPLSHNLNTVNLPNLGVNEGFTKDVAQKLPIVPEKVTGRPVQQPHFDLNALK